MQASEVKFLNVVGEVLEKRIKVSHEPLVKRVETLEFEKGLLQQFIKNAIIDLDIKSMVREAVQEEIAKFSVVDGKDGKDGADGFSLDNFYAHIDGRTLTMRFEDAAHSKEAQVVLPFPLYFELWKEGTTYQRGDWVTREGSIFACIAETTNKMPGIADSGWRLAIKRGRDGKDGKEGKQGPEGKPGRDGKDLTQIGPDGSKWG